MNRKEYLGVGWNLKVDSVENWSYIENLFSAEECDNIVAFGKQYSLNKAGTGNQQHEHKDHDTLIRDSNIVFIEACSEFQWVYERLTSAVLKTNEQFYNFDLFSFGESLQFSEYGVGQKYDYHIDKSYRGVIRKLSISLQLSNPSDYVGGDLQIKIGTDDMQTTRERGSLIVFPSYVLHRVTPVTQGTRYSLVGWVNGNPFK